MKIYRYTKMATLEAYYRTEKQWQQAMTAISEEIWQGKREWEKKEINLYFSIYKYLNNGKLLCSINSPINPVPVCGKFTAPSFYAIDSFLRREGWKRQGAALRLPEEDTGVEVELDV